MKNTINQFGLTFGLNIRIFSICLVSFFLMAFNLDLNAQKVDFSGTWAFNQQKSELGQTPQGRGQGGFGLSGVLKIRQEGNNLTVEREFSRQGETRTMTTKYPLDGKESVNSSGRGSAKSTAVWSSDKKSLTITTINVFEYNNQRRESKNVEVWTLENGGKNLVINSNRSMQQGGEIKTKRVYDKK